jgi:hypothetical protein
VDRELDVLWGPKPVQSNGNVSVPRELLRELGVEPGEHRVHFALNPDMPGTLLVIPSRHLAEVLPETLDRLKSIGR